MTVTYDRTAATLLRPFLSYLITLMVCLSLGLTGLASSPRRIIVEDMLKGPCWSRQWWWLTAACLLAMSAGILFRRHWLAVAAGCAGVVAWSFWGYVGSGMRIT